MLKIKFQKYSNWVKPTINNSKFHFMIFAALTIFDALMVAKLLNSINNQEYFFCFESEQGFARPKKNVILERALDGVIIEEGAATSTRPFAVVIENHFEARPQTGVAQANLVYEFLTEGGITRFLAFYDPSSAVKKIGPVRSCRPYFLNVAEEFGALFTHVGGSPDCIEALKNQSFDVYNLDEYSKTEYFWRDKKRAAPHNVYTSVELANQYLENKNISATSSFESWQFKEDDVAASTTAEKITIDFSLPVYKATWSYDKKNNDYRRYHFYLQIELQKDSYGKDIRAKNIVIEYVKAHVLDSIGRLGLKMEGRGDAIIFQDGQIIRGYWEKSERGVRTKFYSENNEEIKFNRGATWVEIVPTDREVTWE